MFERQGKTPEPVFIALVLPLLVAADAPPTIWQKLDDAVRGRLALALVGFVLLIALLILLVVISARMMRRIARHRPPERPREVSDWDRKEPAGNDE
jgi:hypothetical protein